MKIFLIFIILMSSCSYEEMFSVKLSNTFILDRFLEECKIMNIDVVIADEKVVRYFEKDSLTVRDIIVKVDAEFAMGFIIDNLLTRNNFIDRLEMNGIRYRVIDYYDIKRFDKVKFSNKKYLFKIDSEDRGNAFKIFKNLKNSKE